MLYTIPNEVPAWEVEVYGLAISMPWVAQTVGWIPSSSHAKKVFRSENAAKKYALSVEAEAARSLVPIKWDARISRVTRQPDIFDRLRAYFNFRPYCGSIEILHSAARKDHDNSGKGN